MFQYSNGINGVKHAFYPNIESRLTILQNPILNTRRWLVPASESGIQLSMWLETETTAHLIWVYILTSDYTDDENLENEWDIPTLQIINMYTTDTAVFGTTTNASTNTVRYKRQLCDTFIREIQIKYLKCTLIL